MQTLSQLRNDQMIPSGRWRTFMILADRGWGKSLALLYWLASQTSVRADTQAGFFAPYDADSFAMTCMQISHFIGGMPAYNRSRGAILFPNRSRIQFYNTDRAQRDHIMGHQFHIAACDEINRWGSHDRDLHEMIHRSLRLGDRPQMGVAATPQPMTDLMTKIFTDPQTYVVKINGPESHMPVRLRLPEQTFDGFYEGDFSNGS